MPDDTSSRRSDTSSRRHPQPGFPFWVIRGALTPNSQPAPVSATSRHAHGGERPGSGRTASARRQPAGTHTGRTGVDLRAGAPPAPRATPRASRPSNRRLTLPWKRPTQPSPLPPSPIRRGAGSEIPTRGSRRSAFALLALGCVQALFLAAIAWGLTSPTFQAREVRIQGASDATLLTAIQRLPLAGCNIFRCDLASRVRLVEALPAVSHAEVHTIYPNGLLVVVTPRRPALLWQIGGQSVVVADDGTVLGPLASDPTYAHLPLLPVSDPSAAAFSGRVPPPGARIPAGVAEMAGQLRSGITKALGSGWTLEWTASTGFAASDGSGARVLFGMPTDAAQALTSYPNPAALAAAPSITAVDQGVATQLQVLQALRTQLAQRGQQAVLIDLRWGPHPYYRLANGA